MKRLLSVCLIACARLPGESGAPDATSLMQESVRAEDVNQLAAASWLGREDIRHFAIAGRKRKLTGWETYEASILEGRPYYRKIAIAGRPLPAKQASEEDERMDAELQYRKNTPRKDQTANDRRIGFGLKSALPAHAFKILRAEELRGRRVWLVLGTLQVDAPEPVTTSDGGLSSDLLAWVDQDTKLTLREELTVRKPWASLRPGSTVILEFDFSFGPRLVSRILLRSAPNENGRFTETEQIYSDCKKFGAESQIILQPHR